MKSVMTAMLALGIGFAATASATAAAAPATAAGVRGALAASDPVVLAQGWGERSREAVAPGARPAGVPRARGVVVAPGARVVGPRAVVVAPGARVVGRPAYVGPRVFVRAYRPWYRRPYFGTIVGGVALGTILTAAAVGVAPAYPPADGLCWYWADPSMTTGYWDYCG